MGFFNKSDDTLKKVEETFLDKYPSWCVRHATTLVKDLEKCQDWVDEFSVNREEKEAILVDFLSAAHLIDLSALSASTEIIYILGGEKKVSKIMDLFDKRAKDFFYFAGELIYRNLKKNKDGNTLGTSLMEFYKTDKPLKSYLVDLASAIIFSFEDELKRPHSDTGFFLLRELYNILIRLSVEQADWLSKEILTVKK